MANVKEILGSLLMMFGIIITIIASICVAFFYFFFGPHWTQIFISLIVLLAGVGLLVVGIILFRRSKKLIKTDASKSETSAMTLIGIFLMVFGPLTLAFGLWVTAHLIFVIGIVVLVIGIVLLILGLILGKRKS
jgi:hypothetical protein